MVPGVVYAYVAMTLHECLVTLAFEALRCGWPRRLPADRLSRFDPKRCSERAILLRPVGLV